MPTERFGKIDNDSCFVSWHESLSLFVCAELRLVKLRAQFPRVDQVAVPVGREPGVFVDQVLIVKHQRRRFDGLRHALEFWNWIAF